MAEVSINSAFIFKNNDVRVIQDQRGALWFIATDIASILDYSDTEIMLGELDHDEVQNRQILGFGKRDISLINESGLYSVILASDKSEAKLFKRWITSEVLPTIRKTGSVKPLSLEEMTLQVIQGQQLKILQLEYKIAEQQSLVNLGRAISQSAGSCKVGDWVKAINARGGITIGRNQAFAWLRENGYLMKDNLPYQQHINNGLFEVKEGQIVTETRTIQTFTTLLTGKGQMVLAHKLKSAS